MVSNTLNNINDVAIYPVISLVLFFIVFTAMLYFVFRGGKKKYEKMASLPLDDSEIKNHKH